MDLMGILLLIIVFVFPFFALDRAFRAQEKVKALEERVVQLENIIHANEDK